VGKSVNIGIIGAGCQLEFMDHILPNHDADIALALLGTRRSEGIKVRTGARIEEIEPRAGSYRVRFTEKEDAVKG
jgi:pyruvate/2-oxoglutarate dehydrogenase complex dihydrolipoamide dehydrogenase (E3) component